MTSTGKRTMTLTWCRVLVSADQKALLDAESEANNVRVPTELVMHFVDMLAQEDFSGVHEAPRRVWSKRAMRLVDAFFSDWSPSYTTKWHPDGVLACHGTLQSNPRQTYPLTPVI